MNEEPKQAPAFAMHIGYRPADHTRWSIQGRVQLTLPDQDGKPAQLLVAMADGLPAATAAAMLYELADTLLERPVAGPDTN